MKNQIMVPLAISVVLLLGAAAGISAGPITAFQVPSGGPRGGSITQREHVDYRVRMVSVTGAKVFSNEFLRVMVGLESGKIYEDLQLRRGLDEIGKIYNMSGYINFVYDPSFDFDESNKTVAVIIRVDEGDQYRVSSFRFTGNSMTKDEVLQREILLKEGSVFNPALMEYAMLRINYLGLFEEIKREDFQVTLSPNAKVDIVLRVREKAR